MFGVKLETYKAWENGVNEPPKLSMKHAQLIMAADCVGVPVELYIEHYWRVIKQVAAEMQAKK